MLTPRDIWITFGYGVVLLLWFSSENASVWLVSVLGAGLALVLLRLVVRRWLPTIPLPALVLFGAALGFGAVWAAIGLMIFKNAWHAHAYLDFPASIISQMPRRMIAWTVAGGLMGGAVGLFRVALRPLNP